MAARRGGQSAGLISGATLGAVLGILFPPFVGPLVGMLVGTSLLDLRDARTGARSGLVMGAGAGLVMGLYALLAPGGPLPAAQSFVNSLLGAITLYAGLGAAAGLAGGWLWAALRRGYGMFL